MSVNLTKGSSVNLTKTTATKLATVLIGAGWDKPKDANGVEVSVDLDLSAFALTKDGKCRSSDDFVFYGAESNKAGTIVSSGDNRTGEGDGDDETISINLDNLDADIEKVVFTLTRYDALAAAQVALGEVPNASVRALNAEGNVELAKFDVVGNAGAMSLTFAELVRTSEGWEFKAIGEYSAEDLGALNDKYGV